MQICYHHGKVYCRYFSFVRSFFLSFFFFFSFPPYVENNLPCQEGERRSKQRREEVAGLVSYLDLPRSSGCKVTVTLLGSGYEIRRRGVGGWGWETD